MSRQELFPDYDKVCYGLLENSCEISNLETIKETF